MSKSHSETISDLIHNRRPFYATISQLESKKGVEPVEAENVLILTLPMPGSTMFVYGRELPGAGFRTSLVQSVEIFSDSVKVKTLNSIYILKDLREHV